MSSNALQGALHAELLVEIGEIAQSVSALKESLAPALREITQSADHARVASDSTLAEFNSMGHGLMKAIRDQLAQERTASASTARAATEAARKAQAKTGIALGLLAGLGLLNAAMLVAVLVMR